MTTLETLTDETIRRLETQAAEMGDISFAYMCSVARGNVYTAAELSESPALDAIVQREILALDREAARVLVLAAIQDAEAQV